MSSDAINFKTPLLSFGFSKTDSVTKLKEGETIILRYWSWKSFGYIKKAITKTDGHIEVILL